MRRGIVAICWFAAAAAAQQTADQWYASGMRLFQAHQSEQALAAFRRAVQLQANHAEAWAAMGVVLASRREYTLAEEPFHRACALNPALPDACIYYGRILYLEDRFAEALPVLRNASTRQPQSAEIYRIEGLCLEALGRPAEAEEQFQHAVQLGRSGNAAEDPAIDYGVFLYRAGRTEEAVGPLQSAVERDSNSVRARVELGCTLLALGREQDAAVNLEKAVALDAASARGHLLLGKAYQRMGKTTEATRELDVAARTAK